VQILHAAIKELDEAIGSHEHYEYFLALYAGSDETVSNRLDDLSQVLHGSDRLNDQFVERLIYSMYVQCYKWLTEYDVAHQLLTRVLELGHP
jgi:hypothetical protein